MSWLSSARGWFSGSIAESVGTQNALPSVALVPDTANLGADGALQISTVWACIELRASTIASLPFFAYETVNGEKKLARSSRLYALLKDSPNSRMTPLEFWRALVLNYDLRGNAYARLDRAANGEVIAMWPMPSDQIEVKVLTDGSMVYLYSFDNDVAVLAAENVLHLKNMGNGTVGLSKLEFMRATTDEASRAQTVASKMFGSGGKPTGALMIDKVLTPAQRAGFKSEFAGMTEGSTSRLFVLEAGMKYAQLSLSAEDQQLIESRKLSIEELCRWYAVPPVMVGHSNVTAWGSGIEQLVQGFYTLSLRPLIVSIEQAVTKRVLTSRQRATMTVEISIDALLRGNPKDRADNYAKGLQNGWLAISEVRQLEGWPHIEGTDGLNIQSNLVPLKDLGKLVASGGNGSVLAQ